MSYYNLLLAEGMKLAAASSGGYSPAGGSMADPAAEFASPERGESSGVVLRPRAAAFAATSPRINLDQLLFFNIATRAEIGGLQVGNFLHPQYPGLENFGDVTVRGARAGAWVIITGT